MPKLKIPGASLSPFAVAPLHHGAAPAHLLFIIPYSVSLPAHTTRVLVAAYLPALLRARFDPCAHGARVCVRVRVCEGMPSSLTIYLRFGALCESFSSQSKLEELGGRSDPLNCRCAPAVIFLALAFNILARSRGLVLSLSLSLMRVKRFAENSASGTFCRGAIIMRMI